MQRRHFLAALFFAGLAGCGKTRKLNPISAGATVLAFGDSVTYGTGAASGEDWPTLLAGMTGWRLINAGIPGDTAEAGKARLAALLDEYRPALVIVEIGGNDFLKRRSQQAVKEDLRQILGQIKQSGAPAVLLAVPEFSLLGVVARKPSDAPIYRALAEEEKVVLIDDLFSGILARPEWCADQVHPNAAGYREMAKGIHARLLQTGLLANP